MSSSASCDHAKGCCRGATNAIGTVDSAASEPTLCSDTHHHGDYHEDDSNSALCLAVVRENGTDLVIFDASGIPQTFRYENNDGSDNDMMQEKPQLCFQTHGSTLADDLLTPCFDEHGNHGVPDESCFCGVDTPHLHAHLREVCSTQQNAERLEQFLASQTLFPVVAGIGGYGVGNKGDAQDQDEDAAGLVFSVSDSMPKACNSKEIQERFNNSNIIKACCSKTTTNTYSDYKASHSRRVLQKVRHDDHTDFLVHTADTDELHLEHACGGCGSDDVHGRFQNVGQRRWKNQRRGSRGGDSGKDVHLHFFEVANKPFSILEHLAHVFEPSASDRVATVENIIDTVSPQQKAERKLSLKQQDYTLLPTVKPLASSPANLGNEASLARSILMCDKICCSSEVPIIKTILEPLKGIDRIMVNVSLKQIIVHHDAAAVTATDMAAALNKERLGAVVKSDGGGTAAAGMPESGRSQVFVQHICCASEIPAVNQVVQPMDGVTNVCINTTTKMVFVDHVFGVVSAQQITDALNKAGFGAILKFDASSAVRQQYSSFVRSSLVFESADMDTKALTQFLQTCDATQVETFLVDVPTKSVGVVHNPFSLSAQEIATALSDATGFAVTVSIDGADLATWNLPAFDEDAVDPAAEDHTPVYPRPTVILCGIFWIVSMLSYIGGNWQHLKYVASVSIALGLPPIAVKALRTLRRFRFDANCLMFFASLGAVGLQDYPEAAAVVFLFALSEWLEVRATSRARRALSAIVQLRPEKAHIVHPSTKELVVVPASAVPVGAIVSVKSGEKVPCDGIVIEGRSMVDESSLTGESRPVSKDIDEEVSGGTVNCGMAQLVVRTTRTAENSAVARLIRLVEDAQANRSETEKLVDEFAKVYTPIVVLAAIFMVSIPWAFGPETGRFWTNNGLILIVVACPCALIISTPVSYVAGLAATAQKGVLIKGGAYLEALGLCKTICLDKTGTITTGEFALLHLDIVNNHYSRKEILQYLSVMEDRASHPLAQSVLKAAKNENVSIPSNLLLEKHTTIAGEGLQGVINGLEVYIGNDRMFNRLGLLETLAEADRLKLESWAKLGGTIGLMSIEGAGIVCMFCAADAVRKEAPDVIAAFQKAGMHVIMLTGDNHDAAHAIGSQIGLSSSAIRSKLLPEEKLELVKQVSEGERGHRSIIGNPFSARRLTMMCGDGVNDAPALAAADVGVAMGAGAALAMETADVTLLDSDLNKLAYSIQMGRRVINKIKQNIVFSIAVKLIVLIFALVGKTSLWAAIASDVGAMILVTLNSMLLLPSNSRSSKPKRPAPQDVEAGSLDKEDFAHILDCAPGGAKSALMHAADRSSVSKPHAGQCKMGCCGDLDNNILPGPLPHSHVQAHVNGSNSDTCRQTSDVDLLPPKSCCSKGACNKAAGVIDSKNSSSSTHSRGQISDSLAAGIDDGVKDGKKPLPACQKGCCGDEANPAVVETTCQWHVPDGGAIKSQLDDITALPAKSCCAGGSCSKPSPMDSEEKDVAVQDALL